MTLSEFKTQISKLSNEELAELVGLIKVRTKATEQAYQHHLNGKT